MTKEPANIESLRNLQKLVVNHSARGKKTKLQQAMHAPRSNFRQHQSIQFDEIFFQNYQYEFELFKCCM